MKEFIIALVSIAASLVFSTASNAVTTIPGHGNFDDDNGTELWLPDDQLLAFKYYENPTVTGYTSFGFYFSTDPGTLITIFGAEDQSLDSEAVVDFTTGQVIDVDDGNATQATFTGLGTSIGFWFHINVGYDAFTIFTQSSLTNDDFSFSLPSTTDPSKYALVFFIPESGDTPIAVNVIEGITAIPLPAALPLMLAGLAWLGFTGLRRKSD
jgi:hypothetical protein